MNGTDASSTLVPHSFHVSCVCHILYYQIAFSTLVNADDGYNSERLNCIIIWEYLSGIDRFNVNNACFTCILRSIPPSVGHILLKKTIVFQIKLCRTEFLNVTVQLRLMVMFLVEFNPKIVLVQDNNN